MLDTLPTFGQGQHPSKGTGQVRRLGQWTAEFNPPLQVDVSAMAEKHGVSVPAVRLVIYSAEDSYYPDPDGKTCWTPDRTGYFIGEYQCADKAELAARMFNYNHAVTVERYSQIIAWAGWEALKQEGY